jgi:carbon-monoxide dehydrogenase medium subunit
VLRDFTLWDPVSTREALDLLCRHGDGAAVLAGGTDLLVRMKKGFRRPQALVNLKGIRELCGVTLADDRLSLGSLVTLSELGKSPLVGKYAPVLAQTGRRMASVQIRNLATVGGNICNASPAADLGPPLTVLDAAVKIGGPAGGRELKVADFLTGPGANALAPGELVTALSVPRPGPGERAVYLKYSLRRAHDIALAGAAVWVRLADGIIAGVRIALGAVGPTVLRAYDAEDSLRGAAADRADAARAGRLAALAARPIDDVRAGAAYRREITGVLVARALEQVLAGGEEV